MLATIWNNVLYYPILNLLIVFYHLFGDNLGLAIIIVAIIFRLVLIPFTKKQTEMTKKMAMLKPQIEALQKKYANNQEKLAQEQMKLYKKAGYNPLGCFGSLVPQLIILYALIGVIRAVTDSNFEGLYPFIENWVSPNGAFVLDTQFVVWDLTQSYNGIAEEFGKFAKEALPYLGLAGLVGVSQYFASKFTQKMQDPNQASQKKSKKNAELTPEEMQKKMMGSMNFMLPIMTVFISISAASALSLYWLVQSVMLVVQYAVLDFDKTKDGVQNLLTMRKEGKNAPKKKTSR